ncbi:pyrimidine 5'-nucleotidase [Sneathiella chinensis]|uniref:Pyrimidine 5'-nucleotidase n=1 Tax=Sneathiella chinensis TaxID=349750 RepID=A0ABQ5TZN0_9PROT|nr:pyrimidine 5'-nucleotidase [Sneathiella chinensis]GLQ05447.1 pyrimidine 5'-nucleotidase [Sneathiella chinensis]
MSNTAHWSEFEDINVWIFDLDNTLYPSHSNLFAQIDQKMGEFVSRYLQVELAEAKAIQKKYFREHKTTLNGLMKVHGMPPDDFLDYVHDIDVSNLEKAERLSLALDQLEGRKIIFTNGTCEHATNVSRQLGIDHHFEHIFDIRQCDFLPKPELSVYQKLVSDLEIHPQQAVLFEDMAKNLKPAHEMGMKTVWIPTQEHWSHDLSDGDHIHHVAEDLPDWLHSLLETRPGF